VNRHFTRLNAARDQARLAAVKPENLEELLTNLRTAADPSKQSVLTSHYLAAINEMSTPERSRALEDLRQAWAELRSANPTLTEERKAEGK
jgi:hypothetical protein